MNDAELETKVIKMVAKIVPSRFRKAAITKDSRLISDLGADLMGIVSIAFEMEKELKVTVGQDEFAKHVPTMKTVGDVVNLARTFLSAQDNAAR